MKAAGNETLHNTATRCNTLQHAATHAEFKWQAMTLCKRLQNTATHFCAAAI